MESEFLADWRDKVLFSAEGPSPQIVVENERLKVIVSGLEAGQKIPPHPDALAVYHFLKGTGWMSVDDRRYRVGPGATVITPPGSRRSIEAEDALVFLGVRIA